MAYEPEAYWSRVAERIRARGPRSFLAGDDDPYHRYKRRKFLRRFLASIDVRSKVVLEVGCGPGGNLVELAHREPARLIGVDVSRAMLDLAAENLGDRGTLVELRKNDGTTLPLPDRCVDVTLTVTALQHDTDPLLFRSIVAEICRVTRTAVFVMEDVVPRGTRAATGPGWVQRSVVDYRAEYLKHGFRVVRTEHLGLRASRALHGWVWRNLGARVHKEGTPYPMLARGAMRLGLTFTQILDGILADDRDLTKIVFARQNGLRS